MAAVQTTIKTELCSFSEYRIYPGRGQKFVSRDGKVHTYIHSKEARLGRQKLKAAKLRWTLCLRVGCVEGLAPSQQEEQRRVRGETQNA
ncbi:60S ribosomal protein L24, putative [Eimeria mitis]|uniref:60S ribosomal protein L24, putative n=1 Tax=Eimeria mitis TaxID=44415 RepID=U6KKH9_9EIME|nr:60S ribosomal protein L24, putative [Eimeria mitis]CDJ36782.1 60S ribosomal protein L24, putative [Eimeria mitis]